MKRYGSILLLAAALLAQQPNVATIVAFTEGPTVDAQGNVYFTETTFNRIMKWAPGGKVTVFRENSNAANGLAFDAQGRLVACESGREGARGVARDARSTLARGRPRQAAPGVIAECHPERSEGSAFRCTP